jgi:hypothetical protein
MGTGSFPGVKWPGYGVNHSPPYRAEVKERVQLYIYSSAPSWPVLGWTLPITFWIIFVVQRETLTPPDRLLTNAWNWNTVWKKVQPPLRDLWFSQWCSSRIYRTALHRERLVHYRRFKSTAILLNVGDHQQTRWNVWADSSTSPSVTEAFRTQFFMLRTTHEVFHSSHCRP